MGCCSAALGDRRATRARGLPTRLAGGESGVRVSSARSSTTLAAVAARRKAVARESGSGQGAAPAFLGATSGW